VQNFAFKFQAVAEKTANHVKGLLYFAAPCMYRSKPMFSTNLFHHSLLGPTWTAFSDYTGPDLICSTVFIFSYFSFFLFCVVQ